MSTTNQCVRYNHAVYLTEAFDFAITAEQLAKSDPGGIRRRPLGRTGVEVCVIPGGNHLGLAETRRDAIRKDPAIHLKMLSYDYPFDTCQMPLNVFDGTFRSFEQQCLMVHPGGSGTAFRRKTKLAA